MDKVKKYPKEDIQIIWDAKKCIHSGKSAKGLSAVFKPKDRPWIQPDNASKQEIIDQIEKCPSGALSWE